MYWNSFWRALNGLSTKSVTYFLLRLLHIHHRMFTTFVLWVAKEIRLNIFYIVSVWSINIIWIKLDEICFQWKMKKNGGCANSFLFSVECNSILWFWYMWRQYFWEYQRSSALRQTQIIVSAVIDRIFSKFT